MLSTIRVDGLHLFGKVAWLANSCICGLQALQGGGALPVLSNYPAVRPAVWHDFGKNSLLEQSSAGPFARLKHRILLLYLSLFIYCPCPGA
jgi:hypothetical protein